MVKGTVTRYNEFRGYGFIEGEDSKNYFVHWSFLEGEGYKFLRPGEKVEFDSVTTYDGLQAHNVRYPPHAHEEKTKLKPNPFTPQEPSTDPFKFAGRGEIIKNAIDALFNHKNIIVTGERGIGKSSVAYQLIYMAQGSTTLLDRFNIDTGEFKFSYLTSDYRCVPGNTLADVVTSLEASILSNLNMREKAVKKTTEWGVDLKLFKAGKKIETERIEIPEIAHHFVDFISQISQDGGSLNGIAFLIDEIDVLPPEEIKLASFFKSVIEALSFRTLNNVSFITAGVTGIVTNLITQHHSFSRLFENIELREMNKDELGGIISNAVYKSGVQVRNTVKNKIIELADEFPAPVQLLGYHTFRYDTNLLLGDYDLKRALDFIIRELKRQEFSGLYEQAKGELARKIVREMASGDQNRIKVIEMSKKLKIDIKRTRAVMGDLAKKGILIKVSHDVYKLHDPLFKIYLRWVLDLPPTKKPSN